MVVKEVFDKVYSNFQTKCVSCEDKECKQSIEATLNSWWKEMEAKANEQTKGICGK